MEDVIVCSRCGRPRPASSNSSLGGGCVYCLLSFALSDDELAGDDFAGEGVPADADEAPAPPSRLGPYKILEPLGAGGMGSVYKARHEGLDRIVALKVLKPEFASRQGFPERFQREGQMLAAISHPQIIGVHDLGCDCGIYYLAMQYVEGTTLRDCLRGGRLEAAKATALFSQMCAALQYAHNCGIVHCDIKPENVLIDAAGQVKIADFGIAKLAGAGPAVSAAPTEANVVAGTRRYMAPEQLEPRHAVDQRADLYSLGIVFYEMLTGEVPPDGFAPPSQKAPIDPRLDGPILMALAADPQDRPSDAQTFERLVQQAQSPQSELAARRLASMPRGLFAALCASSLVVLAIFAMRPRNPTESATDQAAPNDPAAPDAPAVPNERVAPSAQTSPAQDRIVLANHAQVWDVAFAPHDPLVASASEDGLVKFWKPEGGEPIGTLPAYPRGELGYLRLAFSGQFPMLATAGGESVARLWDLPAGPGPAQKERQVLSGHAREIVALAFSPDGALLATGSHDRTVKLWNPQDGRLVATLTGHSDPVLCVAFSPDGLTVAAGAMNGAIKLWDTRSHELLWANGHGKRVWSLAFSPQGGLLVSGSHDQTIKFFDLARRTCRQTVSTRGSEVWSVAISSDGLLLASGMHDGCIRLWDIANGGPLSRCKIHSAPVVSLSFSPDGKHLASASLDQTAMICTTAVLLDEPPEPTGE